MTLPLFLRSPRAKELQFREILSYCCLLMKHKTKVWTLGVVFQGEVLCNPGFIHSFLLSSLELTLWLGSGTLLEEMLKPSEKTSSGAKSTRRSKNSILSQLSIFLSFYYFLRDSLCLSSLTGNFVSASIFLISKSSFLF